jgi:DNA-binding NarL/FixJ family response regulator
MARTTIRGLLDWHSFQVCGEAHDGKDAIAKVTELKPDIVLLDINMPGMNGRQRCLRDSANLALDKDCVLDDSRHSSSEA